MAGPAPGMGEQACSVTSSDTEIRAPSAYISDALTMPWPGTTS